MAEKISAGLLSSGERSSESVGRPGSGDAEQYCIYRVCLSKRSRVTSPRAVRLKE